MELPDRDRRYFISERASFNVDWRQGITEGWVNPMTDSTVLAAIREHLSRSPWSAPQVPGWPDNVRAIRFPRSAVYEQGKVLMRYEILGDDGRVWLERIRPII